MKKVLMLSVVLALFSACNKESIDDHLSNSSDLDILKSGKKAEKIDVCHYSEEDGTYDIISISENAWKAHEKHGDVRLDDQDGDGFVPDNECGYGAMGDLDDNDDAIHPILPGQNPDENIIAESINLNNTICRSGSYFAYFTVSGIGLPGAVGDYMFSIYDSNIGSYIDGIVMGLQNINPGEEVMLIVALQNIGDIDIDVKIQINAEYTFLFEDAYTSPCP